MAQSDGDWDPEQYERFRSQRAQPFHDLAALVERAPAMRVVDLGCGTGQLTAWLHDELGATETLGVDASEAMLAEAAPRAGEGLRFQRADISTFEAEQPFDLVFSNAALQWFEGHEALWPRLTACVAPGGQLAVQVPVNDDHPSQRVLREVAAEPPFAGRLRGQTRPFPVLAPERYAELLHELGFARQLVRVHVCTHELPGPRALVEWMKGSAFTPVRERLSEQGRRALPRHVRAATAGRYARALPLPLYLQVPADVGAPRMSLGAQSSSSVPPWPASTLSRR